MTVGSRLGAALFKLPKPETREVEVERDLRVPMRDGTVLLADRWYPKVADAAQRPVLLTRTPYGRSRSGLDARLYAERGYQVVVVSCRGTFGSGGEFVPFRTEADDGQDVFAWLTGQPWGAGKIGTFGGSYVGMTQWAVATDPPEQLAAMAPAVTTANFNELFYPGGTFALATTVNWIHVVAHQEESPRKRLWSLITGGKPIAAGVHTAPIREADVATVGHQVPWYRDWLEHPDPDDEWWSAVRWRGRLDRTPPVSLVAGWYDLFLPHQLADYEALRAAGREVELTIGPWHHISPALNAEATRVTLAWMDRQLRGRTPSGAAASSAAERRGPVRIFVPRGDRRRVLRLFGPKQSGRWVDLPSWPPPAEPQRWYLQPAGELANEVAPDSTPDRYRYDPGAPTPVVGGATLDGRNLGSKVQQRTERHADVLTYVSEPLERDLTVVGPVSAEIHGRSEVDHTDVFVRLCVVDTTEQSWNLCDGIVRLDVSGLRSDDGSFVARVELFPTAITFTAGQRIRVQVASGAHPTSSPNLGRGEPIGTAVDPRPGWREVLHDPDHPSSITLPWCSGL